MRRFTPLLLLCTPALVAAQHTLLVVNVGDGATGAFVADAQVRIPELGRLWRTDWQGEARIAVTPSGDYHIEVRKLGYAPSTVVMRVAGDTAAAFFALDRATSHLDTVRVLAQGSSIASPQIQQFYTDRRMGIARIVTDSMLARAGGRSLAVFFASHFPVRLTPDSNGGWTVANPISKGHRTTLGRGGASSNASCDVWLDGARYFDSLDKIHPDELLGAEYFDDVNAPAQYRNGGACVLLLWSKF